MWGQRVSLLHVLNQPDRYKQGICTFVEFTKQTKAMTINKALLVRLEAKPGKEQAVADFLKAGQTMANDEPATVTWYGIQLGPSTFGIFDTFPDDAGRQAHLNGPIAAALMANAAELLASDPIIEMVDILAAKGVK